MKKAIIVGLNKSVDNDFYLDELIDLAKALDIEVKLVVTQNLDHPNNAYYVGKGKAEEIDLNAKSIEADYVIFDDELSPTQVRNLSNIIETKIMDRTDLILMIFEKRASSRLSQIQVEIAKLRYELPRLIGSNDNLSRQGGSSGAYSKGAGETQLELDRRRIANKISSLKRELNKIIKTRETERGLRYKNKTKIVALAGYTNAGKSSIMNALLKMTKAKDDKEVFEKNQLFATLDTSSRRIKLPNNREFILIDTIGFISKLPHHLIDAFNSTLEDIKNADLIIHVVDISNPDYQTQIDVTNSTFEYLQIQDSKEIITVFNKIDKTFINKNDDSIYISAKKGDGLDNLIKIIDQKLFDLAYCELLIPYNDGKLYSYLKENTEIIKEEFLDSHIEIHCFLSTKDYNKYQKYIKNSLVS